MGEFQTPFQCGLSLRDSPEFSLVMGDSEAEVRQMVLELLESEDLSDHPPIVSNFDMFE
jgi:hypothetical protein